MPNSVSFDRAAPLYESTRGFPPGIGGQVAEAAASFLEAALGQPAPTLRVLEIGVGTGRIARPLLARSVPVIGVDLSRPMMAELIHLLPPHSPRPRLIQGAAECLPLASGRFDAAVAVHVFHLIGGWQAAVAEVRRVLQPRGRLLVGYDWRPPEAPSARLFARWREIVQARGYDGQGPGVRDFDDVRAFLLASGAAMTETRVGAWTVTRTLAHALETIEHRTWSSTWQVPDDFFPSCLAELQAWTLAEYGALERAFPVEHQFVWQAFTWPEEAG